MKNKKTIYNSDEFRKTVQCLTEKIREADELESVDVDKSFQDVMKRVGREKKVPHRRHIYRWVFVDSGSDCFGFSYELVEYQC